MSFTQISTNQPALFSGMESEGFGAPPSYAPVKSARSRNRAAWWRQDLDRTAVYLMGQARTEDERAFVEQLYEQAVEEGPDFINYRAKSAFEAAPRLGIDRNAYARILSALDMIERGTYRPLPREGQARHPAHRGARSQMPFEPRPSLRRGAPVARRHCAARLRLQANRRQLPQAA